MGTYTTEQFLELFGGLPERDDPSWAGPDPREAADIARKEAREDPPPDVDCP